MSTGAVSYALESGIAVLTMDDGKANALSDEVVVGLIAALDRAEKEAAAVVLAGRPDRFSAGFDLKTMMKSPEDAIRLVGRGGEMLVRFYESPLPVVVACTGHALAAGALLVLTGDLRIGADGAFRIGLNEVQIGLPAPILAVELARDRLLSTELARATLAATIYAPAEARRVGYLDEVVAPESVCSRAKEEAARLGALSRRAYAETKKRLRGATVRHVRETMQEDLKAFATG